MNPRDLIKTARDLVESTNRKPRQSNLHRATSTAYYALFHTLAKCAADLLIGGPTAAKSWPAWQQVYRALDHGTIKSACANGAKLGLFPQPIQDFANTFVTLQEKRHKADYDPQARSKKSEVLIDINLTEKAMDAFQQVPVADRRAFAAFVIFRSRK